MLTAIVVVSWKKEGVMKNNEQQANIWLFKVVIFFIVAGFLLSLIPLAKAQEMLKGNEHCREMNANLMVYLQLTRGASRKR